MNAVPLARVRYAAARSATRRDSARRFETTSRRGCGNAAERGGLAMSDAEAEKEGAPYCKHLHGDGTHCLHRTRHDTGYCPQHRADANYCGLGPCAGPAGHEGTCAQASGWDDFTNDAMDRAYEQGFKAGQASRAPQPTEAEWSCEQGCKAPSAVCLLDHRPAPQPPEDDREALALVISEARGSQMM